MREGHDYVNRLPSRRAAYSDRTSWLMAELCRLAYEPFEASEDGRQALRQGLQALGLDLVGEPIHAPPGSPEANYDTQAYVAGHPDLAVLVFRGTDGFLDWRTNVQIGRETLAVREHKVRVHGGFLAAYDAVEAQIGERLTELGDRPLYITGHSLGGAVAQIAAVKLDALELAACYSFGAPRVGGYDLDRYVKAPNYRVTNGIDIVPMVPPLLVGYRHFGDQRHLERGQDWPHRGGHFWTNIAIRQVFALAVLPFTRSVRQLRDHGIGDYKQRLAEIRDARNPTASNASR